MNLQLTQKERMLLEDAKSHEDICIKKYYGYAGQAQDPQLKQIFTKHAQVEQQHYNTIDQMIQGQQPSMNQGQQQSNQPVSPQVAQQPQQASFNAGMKNQNDSVLCSDLLSTEKYVSSTYDIAVFESVNPSVRQTLEHIQHEEHQHGQEIFDYMNTHGMYNVK